MINHSILAVGINSTPGEKIKIQSSLKLKDITLDVASIKDILMTIIDGQITLEINGRSFEEYTYVWIQSGWNTNHMAYLLDLYLLSKNIPHNETNIHNTKLSDIFSLASEGIRVPNMFFHNGLRINEENISNIEKICNFPCIYKTSIGSLGSDVYLINKKSDIFKTIKDNGQYNRYIFQEYIENDFDYRVVIANGRPISVSKRTRVKDKYRNNVALGANEEFIDICDVPKDVLDIATRSANSLNLNWAGVDVVTDKKSGINFVLEVNRRPGLTEESSEIVAACQYITELVGR